MYVGSCSTRRSRVAGVLAGAVAVALVSACGSAGGSSDAGSSGSTQTITVAPGIAPFYVIENLGLPKKYGFKLKITNGFIPAPTLLPSPRKQYDFGLVTIPDLLNGAASGIDVKMFTLDTGESAQHPSTILAADKSITSIKALKGKTIGVIAQSGSGYVALLKEMKAAGLSVGDVKFVAMQTSDMYPALKAGRIQAASIVSPANAEVLADPNYTTLSKPLGDLSSGGTVSAAIVANGAWAKSHAKLVASFRKAMVTSQNWINSHVDQTREVYVKDMGNTPAAAKESTLDRIIDAILGMKPETSYVQTWITTMDDLGLLKKKVSASDVILPWPLGLSAADPTSAQLSGKN